MMGHHNCCYQFTLSSKRRTKGPFVEAAGLVTGSECLVASLSVSELDQFFLPRVKSNLLFCR